nr:transposase [Limosilactobacillus fermentum]
MHDGSLRRWIKGFLQEGVMGVRRSTTNRRYSTDLKVAAVVDYQDNGLSRQEVLHKYNIRSNSQLTDWVIRYNSGKLLAPKGAGKRVRKMGRKVSYDEKIKIVQWALDHDSDYQATAKKFDVSYNRVYGWVRKYQATGNWEVLKDRRGKKPRPKGDALTREERLEEENRQLKAKVRRLEVERAFAKKLREIRNREVDDPQNTKRFRN